MVGVFELINILLSGIIVLFIINKVADIKQNNKVYVIEIVCLCFSVLFWHYIKDTSSLRYIIGIGFDIVNFCIYTALLKKQAILETIATVIAVKILYAFLKIIVTLIVSKNIVWELVPFINGNISVSILIMAIIFGILWIIDRDHAERSRKLLWEDNQRMKARLHRSKEILPLLNNVLEKLKDSGESDEFEILLNEIHQLCNEQTIESVNEDMKYKSFPSTDICVLDEQIELYGQEAARKGINFDVFVNMVMSDTLKERNILILDFLRIIGDLMRNAFRAIEKSKNKTGNILLVMGSVNEVLQVEIYDDGVLFPIQILNEFGKRGNTDGGTGHGLANLLDFLECYHASFKIIEYEGKAQFSKGICISWDQKNDRCIESFRVEQISKASILIPKETVQSRINSNTDIEF